MAGGRILQVHGKNDWDAYQKKSVAEKKLLVVDFTASWCGPCRAIAPVFEQLSNSHTNALFLKVDIDENQDLAMEFGVRGVPAFHLYKGGAKVDELVGANSAALEALVKKHYTEGSFSGQGRTLGTSSSPPSSAATAAGAAAAAAPGGKSAAPGDRSGPAAAAPALLRSSCERTAAATPYSLGASALVVLAGLLFLFLYMQKPDDVEEF